MHPPCALVCFHFRLDFIGFHLYSLKFETAAKHRVSPFSQPRSQVRWAALRPPCSRSCTGSNREYPLFSWGRRKTSDRRRKPTAIEHGVGDPRGASVNLHSHRFTKRRLETQRTTFRNTFPGSSPKCIRNGKPSKKKKRRKSVGRQDRLPGHFMRFWRSTQFDGSLGNRLIPSISSTTLLARTDGESGSTTTTTTTRFVRFRRTKYSQTTGPYTRTTLRRRRRRRSSCLHDDDDFDDEDHGAGAYRAAIH